MTRRVASRQAPKKAVTESRLSTCRKWYSRMVVSSSLPPMLSVRITAVSWPPSSAGISWDLRTFRALLYNKEISKFKKLHIYLQLPTKQPVKVPTRSSWRTRSDPATSLCSSLNGTLHSWLRLQISRWIIRCTTSLILTVLTTLCQRDQ